MSEKTRDYGAEKKAAYDACVAVIEGRPRAQKKERILVEEIRKESNLGIVECANAMKWLKRKELAHTDESGKIGWFLDKMTRHEYPKFCWTHGLYMTVEGKGKKRRVFCEICERNKQDG